MTTEAKVGAFVLSCFALLAFTVIYLLNAQYSGGTCAIAPTCDTPAEN
jgi:Flp pilus assembly protein TadB